MAKSIIFCADGTWNGPGQSNDGREPGTGPSNVITNVLKLYRNLASSAATDDRLATEQESSLSDGNGELEQVAKYLDGVGDTNNAIVHYLEGSTGAGVTARVVRGYTFVSRNYQQGDRIILTGFSRGAYTVRALAGMIAKMGLLDASKTNLADREAAYRLGIRVWFSYREMSPDDHGTWLGRIEEAEVHPLAALQERFAKPLDPGLLVKTSIEAVGVWDTVGALGIPLYNLHEERIDVFQFADRKLSPVVNHGFHAIAIDEQREDFTPTLWEDDPRVDQALFPGAHADIGGGYRVDTGESGLSDRPLQWMMEKLGGVGAIFAKNLPIEPQPNALAPAHEPWSSGVLLTGPRSFPNNLGLAGTVIDRMRADAVRTLPGGSKAAYAPPNLGAYVAGGKALPGVRLV